jgi:hypothetical protein
MTPGELMMTLYRQYEAFAVLKQSESLINQFSGDDCFEI